MSGGSGEEGVLNAAAAQLTNWLGLPSGVAAGMTDSKVPDNQAGYEKGINVALAGHAGANLVYESAGMLGSLLSCSLEALVIDNAPTTGVTDPYREQKLQEERTAAADDYDNAEDDIVAAEDALSELEDEARRAGVPPGWLREK